MKLALITDLHFGSRNDNLKVAEHQKRFYDDVFFPFLRENDISTVVDLGDTFDRRKYISFTSLQAAKKMFFDPLASNDIQLHALVGNHDSVYKNTIELNSIYLLTDGYANVNEYIKPTEVDFDGTLIAMIPWICKDNIEATTELITNTKAQVCFGHLELKGFEMYKGQIIYDGMDSKLFSNFDIVCSGHFHHKSTTGNINYLGAPYEMTWSDYDDPRGFHVFDTATRELTYIQNPYTMFHKIWYDDTDLTFEDINAMDVSEVQNSFVKLVIKTKDNPYLFDTFVSKLEDQNLINLQVVEDHLHLDLEDDEDIIDEAEDTLTILDKYIDGLEISANKQQLQSLMKNLYNEALAIE